MIHVKHLARKVFMAVKYCGHQLALMLGWAASTYHEKESATPHPGACKHSLQYDRRPYEGLGVRVGTWNLGSLSGKGGEVCEELRKGMIDVCFLQEVGLRGQGARMLGMKGRRYKLWGSGKRR